MQHAVLLERGSWMRPSDRSYRKLASRPGDNSVMGDLTLSHPGLDGAIACVADTSAPAKRFHLLHADNTSVSLATPNPSELL